MEVNSANDIFVLYQRHPSCIFYKVLANIWGAIHPVLFFSFFFLFFYDRSILPVLYLLKKLLVSP